MRRKMDIQVDLTDFVTSTEVRVRISNTTEGGFYFTGYLSTEEATNLRDQLTKAIETPVQVPAEIVSEWNRIDNSTRNPLALGDDALGENPIVQPSYEDENGATWLHNPASGAWDIPVSLSQADGDPGDCHEEQAA